MSGLRLVTANVNGIRAAARRGGLDWLARSDADVICLQEVRATAEQLAEAIDSSALAGWHIAHAAAPQLGRAGVAVLTRHRPTAVRERVGARRLDAVGRWIEVDLRSGLTAAQEGGDLTVVSAYVHSGGIGTVRQDEKFAFLRAMDRRLDRLRRDASARGSHVVVCGDFNVAHREVDLKNWKANRGRAGFLAEERAHLDRWFRAHWVDLGRRHGGDGPGPYTWWSWRGTSFDTDGGWRIDYVIATRDLADRCVGATVGRATSYAERWSDHAPLLVEFA